MNPTCGVNLNAAVSLWIDHLISVQNTEFLGKSKSIAGVFDGKLSRFLICHLLNPGSLVRRKCKRTCRHKKWKIFYFLCLHFTRVN